MWQHGWRGSRAIARRPTRPSLTARLVLATVCLLAAGAGVISAACCLAARDYLTRQAGQQLRAYAGDLTSRPFSVFPGSPLAPGVSGPGGLGGGAVSLEIRDAAGQLVMSAGPAPRAVTSGNWLVIAEPVHYQYRHILFVFGAEDSSVVVTSQNRPGLAGTLVVRLSLASIAPPVARLAVTGLAVSGVVVLLVGGLAAVVIRAILRPLTRMERAAAAAAADQAEQALSAAAAAEESARGSTERMRRTIADTARELRRPVQVLHGIANYFPQRERLGADEPDRLMRQVADEAARIEALIDALVRHQAAPEHDGPG